MAYVKTKHEMVTLTNDYGANVDGVLVTCQRCDHSVEVFGESDASVRRGCAMLRKECPLGENNYYSIEPST